MAADPIVTQQAREWVDQLNAGTGLSGNWRLQVLQKRYRKNAHGECGNELPMRIRRFANGCPWALVDEAIRYLISLAPYSKEKGTGIIYNGLLVDQAYRPTLTQWTRDEQSSVNEQNPRNGTYTLIQDLIEDTECEDSETATTSVSCSETVITTWHWDDSAPGDLADYTSGCEQGVTYAITQVNRKEDGTFDWALVKRIANTQHSGPVTVECSSDSRTTVETWDNLYGSEGEGYHAKGCEFPGPVTLPGCDDTEPGVRTQVQVTKNPDCTLRAVVTRKESFPYTTDWDEGTACRSVKVTHLFNQKTEPDVPNPDVGETVQAQISKNEDDSYNAQIRVTSAPEEVELHWKDGSNCRPREVSQYTNMRSKPEVPKIADGESLSASLKKNDDCTWDAIFAVTKPAVEAVEEWDQGSPCRPEHVTSYQNSADKPVIPKLEAGKVIAASIRKNDDCTWDGQVSVKNAPEGEDFEWEQGSACRPEHVTRVIRSKDVPDVPKPEAGQYVQASISKNEDDCTYDAQITVREPGDSTPVEYITGSACTTVTEKSVRGAAEPLKMPTPKVGETVQGNVSRNDDCTYDSRYSITMSTPDEMQWEEGNAVTKTKSHHLVNQHDKTVPVEPPEFGSMSASVSKNADCTYDISYKVTELTKEIEETWDDGGPCRRSHHTIWDNVHEKPDIPDGADGETVRASLSYNSGTNTWSGQMTRTDPFSADRELKWEDGTRVQKRTHHQYIDKAIDDPQSLIPGFENGKQVNASFSFDSNNCTWNGTVTEVERPDEQKDVKWDDGGKCKPTHHTIWVNRHERPAEADDDAKPGATKRVSLNWDPSTDTWSGQMSVTDPFQANEDLTWEDGPSCQRTSHQLFIDVPDKPDVAPGEDGEIVRASLSYNENNCTWSGQVSRTEPAKPDVMTWKEGTGCRPVSASRLVNQKSYEGLIPKPGSDLSVSGSITKNADCTYDVSYKVAQALPHSTGWITWDSVTVTQTSKLYYHHGFNIFQNQETVPTPPMGSNVNVEAHLNEYCLYDGRISYNDLYKWESYDSGGGEGGIRNGDMKLTKTLCDKLGIPYEQEVTRQTVVFIGRGNEGTEAEYISRGYVSIGGHGNVRGYVNPEAIGKTPWKKKKA